MKRGDVLLFFAIALVAVGFVLVMESSHGRRQPQPAQATHAEADTSAAQPLASLSPSSTQSQPPATAPPLGWTTWAEVVDVHDGDTVRVRVTREIDVRMEDCWAPELRDPGGPESRGNLMAYAPLGERLYLFVPGSERGRLSDEFTFGRVVGRLYTVGGQDLSRMQVEDGHARASK